MEQITALMSDDVVEDVQIAWKQLNPTFAGARPWKEFFEVFKPTGSDLERRMSTNLLHYKANYCQIVVGVAAAGLLCSPRTILALAVAGAAAAVVATARTATQCVHIGGRRVALSRRNRALAAAAVACLVLVLFGAVLWLLMTVSVALLLPLAHMALRPRNFAAKYGAATEEVRSLFGGGAAARRRVRAARPSPERRGRRT